MSAREALDGVDTNPLQAEVDNDGTIQVDFNLPSRFDLGYIDENNERKQPVMLHRAILGSFERFIGILIEHTAGELPFFIAPTGVSIIPINDAHLNYAKEDKKKYDKSI